MLPSLALRVGIGPCVIRQKPRETGKRKTKLKDAAGGCKPRPAPGLGFALAGARVAAAGRLAVSAG